MRSAWNTIKGLVFIFLVCVAAYIIIEIAAPLLKGN